MNKYAFGAIALGGLAAAPTMAATTATYTMTGSVTTLCTVTATGTLAFGTLINGTTGATSIQTPNPTSVDNSAFCNQAQTTVNVKHTDLVATGVATSSGFVNTVPISSVKVTTPQNATGVTDNTAVPVGGTSPGSSGTGPLGAFTQMTVQAFSGAPTGSLVASNNYSGTVTITLTPAS